jgi:hypothetical protein
LVDQFCTWRFESTNRQMKILIQVINRRFTGPE